MRNHAAPQHRPAPSLRIGRRAGVPAAAEEHKRRGRHKDARQIGPAHNPVGGLVAFQDLEDRVLMQAWVSELDRDSHPPGQAGQEVLEPSVVPHMPWGELDQEHSAAVGQLLPRCGHTFDPDFRGIEPFARVRPRAAFTDI